MADASASDTAVRALDKASEAHVLGLVNQERLNNHEEQCAERYQGILDGLAQLQRWIMGAAFGAVLLLIGALGTLSVMWIRAIVAG